MRWWVLGIVIACFAVGVVVLLRVQQQRTSSMVSPVGSLVVHPLDTYTVDALSKRVYEGSQIVLDEPIATTSAYTVHPFYFISDGKKVTGLAHIPVRSIDSGNQRIKEDQKYPVIVQFRGYVDLERYTPGEGTKHTSEVFARNGFVTLAPDFLGYGGSASPSADVFEERFETYTTAMNLLASIPTLPVADATRIGIWGHSNGGQIALTVLEISGKSYPASLWAPVSKPFPYSILYYTDDIPDHGKALRKKTAAFEQDYDAELYSLTNYVDRIKGSMQIHQGTADDAVPQKWSDVLVDEIKKQDKDVRYYIYPDADHNMLGAWDTAVSRDVSFFRKELAH